MKYAPLTVCGKEKEGTPAGCETGQESEMEAVMRARCERGQDRDMREDRRAT